MKRNANLKIFPDKGCLFFPKGQTLFAGVICYHPKHSGFSLCLDPHPHTYTRMQGPWENNIAGNRFLSTRCTCASLEQVSRNTKNFILELLLSKNPSLPVPEFCLRRSSGRALSGGRRVDIILQTMFPRKKLCKESGPVLLRASFLSYIYFILLCI